MVEKDTIKGLECCLDEKIEKCDECPYCVDTIMCKRRELLEDSLDLINHKQELLEAAIAGQETLQKALAEKDREIERLIAEKERLIKTFGECQTEAARVLVEKDKEIERLKNELFCLANERDSIASRNGTGELKMRDYLFRGKRIDNGEWITGFYVHYDDTKDNHKDDCDYIVGIHTGEHFPFFEVIPETVGQFTGLSDKNGKKIFEGDIVTENSGDVRLLCDINKKKNHIGVVKFGEHSVPSDDPFEWGEAYGFFIDGEVFTPAISEYGYYHDYDLEVIGNIYDNPELLKDGEK